MAIIPVVSALRRILVVNDQVEQLNSLASQMLAFGYDVESAADGYEALAKLHFDIDLALLDTDMPGLDGYEVAARIRDDGTMHDLPIVMVSGDGRPVSREHQLRAFEVGADDFISAPVDTVALKFRITSLIRMKTARDEVRRAQQDLERLVERRSASLRSALDSLVGAQRQLRDAQIDTIHRLAVVAEYKDPDTAAHLRRISLYCDMIGRRLGLTPGEIEKLRYASPMHDVGKIGIEPAILLKPGPLDDLEWGQMRTHPVIGGKILTRSHSDFLQTGEAIALTHHERWDGSGYPNGLAGEDIPLAGRICAVADVYDALTSRRCYKEAVPPEDALRMMEAAKRSHFEPELVDLLIDARDEAQELRSSMTQD
ncbi:MAG: response regulator [Calditrichaeota bacterium]|nr:response regulator [Calditrichota bacterium]